MVVFNIKKDEKEKEYRCIAKDTLTGIDLFISYGHNEEESIKNCLNLKYLD